MARRCTDLMLLLLVVIAFTVEGSDIGTPCKILCENGEEMKECDRYTERFKCCGPCVQPTCDNPEPVQDCKATCKADCFCADGYIRLHENGPCVLKSKCGGIHTN